MKKGLKSHSKEKEEKTPVNFSQCAHFFFHWKKKVCLVQWQYLPKIQWWFNYKYPPKAIKNECKKILICTQYLIQSGLVRYSDLDTSWNKMMG